MCNGKWAVSPLDGCRSKIKRQRQLQSSERTKRTEVHDCMLSSCAGKWVVVFLGNV